MLRMREGRSSHDFPLKLICLKVARYFVEEPFCAVFEKNSGMEKFMEKREWGGLRIFRENCFVSQYRFIS